MVRFVFSTWYTDQGENRHGKSSHRKFTTAHEICPTNATPNYYYSLRPVNSAYCRQVAAVKILVTIQIKTDSRPIQREYTKPIKVTTTTTTNPPQSHLGTARRRPSRKESHWYNGRPQIHPKLHLPLRRSPPPSNTPILRPPKRHPDPISSFAKIHFPDRQTDRQTDRQMR